MLVRSIYFYYSKNIYIVMSGQISDANQLAVVFNQNAGVTTTGPGYGTVPPNPYNSESYSSNVSIFRNQVFVQPVPEPESNA